MSVKPDFKELYSISVQFLKAVAGELDPYTADKGIILEEGQKTILLTPSHIQYARYGRGPGKNPPLEPILKWVQKNGIQFGDLDDNGTAKQIQFSIGKKGTKNWVQNAPNALETAIDKHMVEYLSTLNSQVMITLSNPLGEIMKKIDYKKIL